MHYVEAGQGSPVVLVHGSFTDHRYWTLQRDVLAARFRIFAVSLRPYVPNGQATPPGAFSMPQYVDDLSRFVEALAVGPVQLCGHSLGGHIALRTALAIPDLVRSLVLAEPGGPLAPDLAVPSGPPPAINPMALAARLIEAGDTDAGLDLLIASAAHAGAWDSYPEFYRASARDNARTLIAQAVEKRLPITVDDLRSVCPPVLLIGGAISPPPFPATLDAFEAHLRDVTRVRIARGTHLMNIENPDDFNAVVIAFLARHAVT